MTPDTAVFTAGRENTPSGRKRGYADWRPQAKTRVLLAQVDAVLEEYEAHLPLSIRQIFYRLVATVDYPKTEQAYDSLGEHLGRARRARMLPFDVIRDDGIVTQRVDYYDSPADFWDATGHRIRHYRRDRQAGQPCFIELWCEAAGMLPQLAKVAEAYSVPVFSGGGFQSITAKRDVADRALRRNGATVLLYVGDHDPSGKSMFTSFAQDIDAFVKADRVLATQQVAADLVALSAEQVERHNLPTSPPKATDSRSKGWTGGTCQLEALAPDVLADLVRQAIEARRDLGRLWDVMEAEREDRSDLLNRLQRGDT